MKKIISITIAIVCFSCDKYVPYTMYIDNQTNDTIQIVFLDKSPYKMLNADSLFFPPLQKKLFYNVEGDPMKEGCYTGIKEDEVKIVSVLGKSLRKDIWNVKNWICSGNFKDGWKMIFVITENDLID